MAYIIRHAQIATDNWRLLEPNEAAELALASAARDGRGLLVPLAVWLAHGEVMRSQHTALGVLLDGHADPAPLAPDLSRLALIAIHFARFTDGRGYSAARLIRGRYGYRGELRALGDILSDQLFYLSRVGFDSFALRADQDPVAALAALKPFTETYQAAADQPLPLFRRRLASA